MNYVQKLYVVGTLLTLAGLAKCERNETQQTKQEPLKDHICNTQPNGATIANSKDCHKFYICIQQKPYEYNCNVAYHYDAKLRSCVLGTTCNSDYDKNVTCAEGDIRAVEDNCNMFETCIKGQYQKTNCLSGYYFNVQQISCVPFKFDAQFKCSCLMPEYTVFENNNNCENYFVCRKKMAISEKCPLGEYYNSELNTCLTDLEGICLIKPTTKLQLLKDLSINKTANVERDVQAVCRHLRLNNIHFQQFPKDCNAFYICVNGDLFTQHCPQDFYYDIEKKYCIIDVTNKCLHT